MTVRKPHRGPDKRGGAPARAHGRRIAHVVAASLLLCAVASCKKEETAAAPDAAAKPDLATVTIAPKTARREQAWDGVIEAVNESTMSAQTSGRVLELPFDVNDYVPEGSLIVRLTDVEQQAALRQAQAGADEAEAQYTRIEELYKKKVVAKASLDQARTRRESAIAALHTAQQQLEYTTVKAPYAGYVTKRFVRIGEEVQPGNPLISGISLNQLRVAVEIPQSAADAIRSFAAADVLLDPASDKRVTATGITVFPYADPQTHSFTVRVALPEENLGLYPGMTVKVLFAIGETERLLVPVSALVNRSEFSGIYVVGKDHVTLRQLRLGHRYGEEIEVLAGLASGEEIASDPATAASYVAERHKEGRAP